MPAYDAKTTFLRRFDHIWAQARWVQVFQSLCWSLLILLIGISALTLLDFYWELSEFVRGVCLAATVVTACLAALSLIVRSFTRWRRQTTAAVIEDVFPQLGQRIRTTVQYSPLQADDLAHAGVTSTMVAALEADTIARAQPLPLDAVIPWKALAVTSLLAAMVGLLLTGASFSSWEWRTAARRALLANEPYTRLHVTPGNLTLREGESATIEVEVHGRTGKPLEFAMQVAGGGPGDIDRDVAGDDDRRGSSDPGGDHGGHSTWQTREIRPAPANGSEPDVARYSIPLNRIRNPLRYRVSSAGVTSDTFQVVVLYPLRLQKIRTAVEPPAYTGLPVTMAESGQITALAGSQVQMTIELDRVPDSAWLEMRALNQSVTDLSPARRLPLRIDGTRLQSTFEVQTDQTYSVVARAADQMELPDNQFRIRALRDEPPQVWFDSPTEALEVHSLAEVLMRIRVTDDLGLRRAGIIFEVNNEDELPLLVEDFAAAAQEMQSTGTLTPQTRAQLEKVLPLEHFQLSQQDSILYYAFAEDNRPGNAQRTESDLRFIDIRPFRRNYRLMDNSPEDAQTGRSPGLRSLEELIARQRYALNRTVQIERQFKHQVQPELAGVEALLKFQGELAMLTRELALGLEARGINETELLYQAESAMLSAADALSAGQYPTATLQERDALKYLIEGRNRINLIIFKNPDPNLAAQLRLFDRMQRQKLRRPKTSEQEKREVIRRLDELARSEEFIVQSVAAMLSVTTAPSANHGTGSAPSGNRTSGAGAKPPTVPDPTTLSEAAADQTSLAADTQQASGQNQKPEQEPVLPTAQELRDRQLDIALEAREVQRLLEKITDVTALAKSRMTSATLQAEAIAVALTSGHKEIASQSADDVAGQFRELADQVRALLADEQVQRLAAAQQMAANLAREQQEFADRLAQPSLPLSGGQMISSPQKMAGAGTLPRADPEGRGLQSQAVKMAHQMQTLMDVLQAIIRQSRPQDGEDAARQVEELMGAMKLAELSARLQELPSQVGGGQLPSARTTAADAAERLEAAAEKLAGLQRSLVAPRVEEFARLDRQVAQLAEALKEVKESSDLTAWKVQATELQVALEKSGISPELKEEFAELLRSGGLPVRVLPDRPEWARGANGDLTAPGGYRQMLQKLQDETRQRMQELMLGDLAESRDEVIPPQYQDLVDRFQQVLTTDGRSRSPAPADRPQK